jgi:hypothetical protein
MPYERPAGWQFEFTPEAKQWFMGLSAHDADQIAATFDHLERHGPALRRPLAGSIKGSRHHNMKELRSVGGHLRALFVFGPDQRAIVLLGGDKTNDWKRWYKRNIPIADKLYDRHLRALGQEGAWRTRAPQAGRRSAARGR